MPSYGVKIFLLVLLLAATSCGIVEKFRSSTSKKFKSDFSFEQIRIVFPEALDYIEPPKRERKPAKNKRSVSNTSNRPAYIEITRQNEKIETTERRDTSGTVRKPAGTDNLNRLITLVVLLIVLILVFRFARPRQK